MDVAAIMWAIAVPIVVLAAAFLRWRDSGDRGGYVAPAAPPSRPAHAAGDAHSHAVSRPGPAPNPPPPAGGGTAVPPPAPDAVAIDEVIRLLAQTPIRWPDGSVSRPSASRLAAFVGGRREVALTRVRQLMPAPALEDYNPADHLKVDHGQRLITRG